MKYIFICILALSRKDVKEQNNAAIRFRFRDKEVQRLHYINGNHHRIFPLIDKTYHG